MAITQEQIKSIRQELNSLKPDAVTQGNQELTVKQTIMALAPTLERMKKRGFELTEIVARLHDKGIEVKPQTLAKYLAEARREKDARKNKRQAANPHCSAPPPQGGRRIRTPAELATAAQKTACRNVGPQAADTPPPVAKATGIAKQLDNGKGSRVLMGGFEIIPDTPLGEL